MQNLKFKMRRFLPLVMLHLLPAANLVLMISALTFAGTVCVLTLLKVVSETIGMFAVLQCLSVICAPSVIIVLFAVIAAVRDYRRKY